MTCNSKTARLAYCNTARSHVIPLCYSLFQTTLTQPVGVIDFEHGLMRNFQADGKTWQDTPYTVPQNLLQKNLDWSYRVCAEGDGKVYVLNTRDMILHCLDVGSRQWAETRQVDTSYRTSYAAGTYSNGRLYVSGGDSLDGQGQNTMVKLAVTGGGNSRVSVEQQPDMLYRRSCHGMAGVEERILVCGGVGGKGCLANSEMFDVATGNWSRIDYMTVAKSNFGLIPRATAVFELGGNVTRYESSDLSVVLKDTVSVFDWQTRQWSPLPTLPMLLSDIQGVYRGGSLWVLAAVTGQRVNENNPGRVFYERLTCVLEFNVTQQRWVAHRNTPTRCRDCRVVCLHLPTVTQPH